MPETMTRGEEHPITTVKLQPGEKVALCRCWQSKSFPLCDGSHRDVEGKGPVIVQVPEKPQSE